MFDTRNAIRLAAFVKMAAAVSRERLSIPWVATANTIHIVFSGFGKDRFEVADEVLGFFSPKALSETFDSITWLWTLRRADRAQRIGRNVSRVALGDGAFPEYWPFRGVLVWLR